MIEVRIHEEQGLDSNFATKEVESGLTGMLVIHLRHGEANWGDKFKQGGDVSELVNCLTRGVRELKKFEEGNQ